MTKHHSPILCVTDLKENAPEVLKLAAEMAKKYRGSLHVLYPYRMQFEYARTDLLNLRRKVEETGREKVKAFMDENNTSGSFNWEFHPEIGFPAQRIKSKIKEESFSFLIIGEDTLHSMEDGEDVIVPQLLDECRIPLVVVPRKTGVPVNH